jgi:hypothetical protein
MRTLCVLAFLPALVLASACEKNEVPAVSPTGEAATPPPTVEAEPEPPADAGELPAEGSGSVADGGAPTDLREPPAPEPAPGELVVSREACSSDDDCVKATCCHATACVAAANAPSCAGKACTMDCRAGTMDCGGGCLCHEGFCAARLAPDLSAGG